MELRKRASRILLLALTALLALGASALASEYPNGHLLAEIDWLEANLNDPNIRILDLRSSRDYATAHIPGALNVPGSGALNDPDIEVDGWMLGLEKFQALMRELGVNEDTTVVVYDRDSGTAATRMFYGLELYGHFDKVKILNGGFSTWVAGGKSITREVPTVAPGNFTATLIPERIATAEYIAERLAEGNLTLVDTRSTAEYVGDNVRAARGGHIPGAVHLEWTNNLTENNQFKSADELFAMYESIGVSQDDEIIPYCQTNVRGTHTYFTLRLLGYENVRPYEGSWAEWGNREDLPIALGQL